MRIQALTVTHGVNGEGFVQILAHADNELAGVFLSRSCRGKWLSVLFVYLYPFLDGLTELAYTPWPRHLRECRRA